MHLHTIDRNKSPLTISGKSSCGHSEGLANFFRASIYRAHCAVIFAIARLSCSCCCSISWWVITELTGCADSVMCVVICYTADVHHWCCPSTTLPCLPSQHVHCLVCWTGWTSHWPMSKSISRYIHAFSCSSHLYLTSMMGDKTTSPQHTRTCFLMTNSFMLLLIELPFCTNVFQPYSYIFLKPVSGFEVWHFYITYVFLKLYIRCFSYFISIYILSVCNTCAIVTCFY